MPSQSSNQTALRADNHKVELYFGVFLGSVVFTATVDSTPTFPATALTVTAVSGSASDVKRGFRVTIESSGGEFKGETRIRDSGTISSTNIPLRELSKADIDVRATDVVKVYNIVTLSDRLVDATAEFNPDGTAYSNQNSVIAPLPCSLGAWMGFVDSGQTYATVPFDASNSIAVDEDSGGTLTYSWSAPTATGTTSSTSVNPSFTFPVGYHLVTLVVTDSSNSATATQYIPVRVYNDSSDAPYDCLLPSGISADEENGWNGSVQLFEDATLADLPDRSLVCVFKRERINGSVQSFGSASTGRSHMVTLGYLNRDDNRGNADNTEVVFDIVSPIQRLSELPGFSKVMISATSPANWGEIEGLSVKRAIIQSLRRYTFLTELFDLVFNITDATYPRFYLQKSVPREQVKELADGLDARFTCDRTGHFYIHTHPALIALGSRSGITTTLTATDADLVDFQFARNHFRVIEVLEARGFTSGSDPQPMFSRYPGTPGLGAQSMTIERLIASSQTDLNERCGRRGAFNDNVFIDTNGIMRMAVDAEINLPGSYDVFDPAYREYVVISLNDTTNKRGVDLSDYRFYVRGVTVDYADGTATVTLRLRSETNAPAGSTYVPPQEGDVELPPITPPELDNPGGIVIPPGATPGIGSGNIVAFNTDGYRYLTTNYFTPSSASGPTWSRSSMSISGSFADAVPDAFVANAGWIATTTGIYRFTNIASSPSYALVHTFSGDHTAPTSGDYIAIETNRAAQNFVVCVYGQSGSGADPGFSIAATSDGSSWTVTDITNAYSTLYGGTPDVFVSARTPGLAWVTVPTVTGNSPTYRVYETTDYGANWAISTTFNFLLYIAPTIHIPYADESKMLGVTWNGGDVFDAKIQRNGTNLLDYAPRRRGLRTDDANGNIAVIVANPDVSVLPGNLEVYTSTNMLSSSPTITQVSSNNTNYVCGATVNGAYFVWGASGAIGYSPSLYAAPDDRRGNIPTDFPSAGTFVNIMGVSV